MPSYENYINGRYIANLPYLVEVSYCTVETGCTSTSICPNFGETGSVLGWCPKKNVETSGRWTRIGDDDGRASQIRDFSDDFNLDKIQSVSGTISEVRYWFLSCRLSTCCMAHFWRELSLLSWLTRLIPESYIGWVGNICQRHLFSSDADFTTHPVWWGYLQPLARYCHSCFL